MLVLHTQEYAVLGLELRFAKRGDLWEAVFAKKNGNVCPLVRAIFDEAWLVRPIRVLPPSDPSPQGPSFHAFRMMLDPKENATPLLQAAAKDAFRGMNNEHMVDLIREMKVPYEGRRPTLEIDLVRLLISWRFPAMEEREMADIVKKRTTKATPVFTTAMTPENCKVVGEEGSDMMQDREGQTMKERAAKYVNRILGEAQ
eukprot:3892656-Pyramimonas_sp.AAC.1